MKIKKKIIGGLFTLALTAAAFGAAACGGEKVTLVDWTNSETANATLGEIFRLENTSYKDVDGNTHYCDVTVKDSKGNKVVCIANEFEVLDVNGYTATYTVEVAAGDVRKRTVKIGVKDDSAPTISVDLATGFVGQSYQIPEIVVEDLSGEDIKPEYKVYRVDGEENKTEIALNGGKFTPTTAGSYQLSVTAKDKAGNVATLDKPFGIRVRPQENILENFDHPSSIVNSVNGDNQEWLESFQGKQGVVHISGTDSEKTAYMFRFIGDATTYRHVPFNSITVSLYFTKRADIYPTTAEGTEATWFNGEAGQWLDFTITDFEDWNYLFNGGTSARGAQLFWSWTKFTDVYIDEIRFSATPKLEFSCSAENGVAKMGDEVSVSATVPTDNRLEPWITVKSPSGQKVRVNNGKFILTEAGYYTVTASVETAEWSFYDTTDSIKVLSLGNYVKVGETFLDTDMGGVYALVEQHEFNTAYTLPTAVLYDPIAKQELVSDISYTVTYGGEQVAVNGGVFTPDREGIYRIVYTASTAAGEDYETECELYVARTVLETKELINFATKADEDNVSYGQDGQMNGIAPVWLPEYKGRAGVIKLNDKAKESGYNIRIDKTYDELKNLAWEFVDIDIYLESGDWLNYGIAVQSEQVSGKIEANGNTPWKSGEWTTLSIPKAKMDNPDGFLRAITSTSGGQILWGWDLNNVYIDGIRLRSINSTLNSFDGAASATECLNGTNGVGTKATWLSNYQGATGVIKTNDGGAMGGYYLRAANHSISELKTIEWDYIEVKVWVTNGSWVCFYNSALNVQLVGGEWNTLQISKSTIAAEFGGDIANFYDYLVASTGAQLFWAYDDMGDVYFDSITLKKNA